MMIHRVLSPYTINTAIFSGGYYLEYHCDYDDDDDDRSIGEIPCDDRLSVAC